MLSPIRKCFVCPRQDSNLQCGVRSPKVYPLAYEGITECKALAAGPPRRFELLPELPPVLPLHQGGRFPFGGKFATFPEPPVGFEPTSTSFVAKQSSPDIRRHGADSRIRTGTLSLED